MSAPRTSAEKAIDELIVAAYRAKVALNGREGMRAAHARGLIEGALTASRQAREMLACKESGMFSKSDIPLPEPPKKPSV